MAQETFSPETPVLALESGVTGKAYLRRAFRELGLREVTFVRDAAEGLRVGRAQRFGLILISTSLAGGNAFDVFFTLRSEGKNTETPMIFLYREGEEGVAKRATMIAGCETLLRPVKIAELHRLLEEIFGAPIPAWAPAPGGEAMPPAAAEPPLGPPEGEGRELLDQGDVEGAERAFRDLMEHHRNSVDLYFDLAEVCFSRGENEAAEQMLREAERIDGEARRKFMWRERSFVRRGNRKLRARQCRGAKNEFEGAIVANEKSVPGHFGLGESYQCLGDPASAAQHFEKALSIDERPYDLHVYNRMGIAARRERDYNKALRAYDRALSFDGEDPVLYYNKAMVFVAQRLYKSALASLKRALELDPDFSEAAEARRAIVEAVKRQARPEKEQIVLSDETRMEPEAREAER